MRNRIECMQRLSQVEIMCSAGVSGAWERWLSALGIDHADPVVEQVEEE
jgi:hypothetical protein